MTDLSALYRRFGGIATIAIDVEEEVLNHVTIL